VFFKVFDSLLGCLLKTIEPVSSSLEKIVANCANS
jgi:hypothetical protein